MKNQKQMEGCVDDSQVYFSLTSARDVLAARLDGHIKEGNEADANAELEVLNQIQRSLRCPIFRSLEAYAEDKRRSWFILTPADRFVEAG